MGQGGGVNLPAGVLPLSQEDEKKILLTLIEELDCNLALNLDTRPNLHPDYVAGRNVAKFLVVGASNAGCTADALERAGLSVTCAIIPGWRCIKLKIGAMTELVQEKLTGIKDPCALVIQMYDNSFYLAKPEEGGLLPAVWEMWVVHTTFTVTLSSPPRSCNTPPSSSASPFWRLLLLTRLSW